jgi:hypothetical protein
VANEPTVHVRASSIERAWKSTGGNEVWLLVKGSHLAFEDFVAAVDHVNQPSLEHSSVLGTFPTTSPLGHVVMASGVVDPEPLRAWLEMFAQELERRGVSATVAAAPEAKVPSWGSPSGGGPVPTVFVAWSIDLDATTQDPARNGNWHVRGDVTSEIASFASGWARKAGSRILLRQNVYTPELHDTDVAAPLASCVQQTGMSGVVTIDAGHERGRQVSLNPGGEGTFQVIDDETWEHRVPGLREALLALPAHTDHAYVRTGLRYALGLLSLGRVYPLPGIRESHVRYNKHLLGDYVPDAHGLQVLTDSHLRKARDLSRWNITDLGHGRHLVEAPDLEPWYSHPVPDEGVLEQARHDFGEMLLSEQVIADNPAPWR